MTRRAPTTALVLTLMLILLGCDPQEPVGDTITPEVNGSAIPVGLTTWSSGSGTTAVPTFGKTCRLAATYITSAASNGVQDDSLQMVAPNSDATVTIVVMSAEGLVLNAQVTMARGLKDKSYRSASGQATWGFPPRSGFVVDGTLCFPQRLTDGVPTPGEFSLVMDDGVGNYHSVSGTVNLPGSAVHVGGDTLGLEIQALNIEIALD